MAIVAIIEIIMTVKTESNVTLKVVRLFARL